jgi:hypothetical protein
MKVSIMPDRPNRLAQFINDRLPSAEEAVQVLCEDHVGTYTLPFLCRWTTNAWINTATSAPIEADVVGWRPAPEPVAATANRRRSFA